MAVIQLKGGFTAKDPRLDRLPQFDPKSRQYRVRNFIFHNEPLENYPIKSRTWTIKVWLDQGIEGRCVEYGICHDLLATPKVVAEVPLVRAILADRLIYWPAQREDQWEGGSYPGASPQYEGTSVLAGVTVAKRLGLYKEFRWALSLRGALLGMAHIGPLILGVNWYEGMHDIDSKGYLHVEGEQTGGHCILANCARIIWTRKPTPEQARTDDVMDFIDMDRSWIGLHNSWGQSWGVNGRAKISLRDFDRLRQEDGEVCIITERNRPSELLAA